MNDDEIRATVLRLLHGIAPDIDPATLDPAIPLQEQADIDSVDLMSLMVGIEQELHVDVPERDHAKVASLDGCVAYVRGRLATPAG